MVLAKQAMDDLELLPEVCDPFPGGAEGEAVGRVLALHPAGSHSERDSATGDLVCGRGRTGEHRGVPEGRRRDQGAELQPGRVRGETADRRPGVERRAGLVESGDVVVGAEQRLDAVLLAG